MKQNIVFSIGVILIYTLTGYTLSTLWEWFIVPIGFPSISIEQGIGFVLIVLTIAFSINTKFEVQSIRQLKHKFFDLFIYRIALLVYMLVFGFIVQYIGGL